MSFNRAIALVVTLATLSAAPASAHAQGRRVPAVPGRDRHAAAVQDGPFHLDVTAGVRQYTWKEYVQGAADPVLTESGMQYVVNVQPRYLLLDNRRLSLEAEAQLFLGTVGYTGATQAGAPVNTDTGYFGYELNPRVGYVLSFGRSFQLTPLFGFGLESWNRDLHDVRNPNGTFAGTGYVEHYTSLYVQGGARAAFDVTRRVRLHGMVGLKMPVSISESVDMTRHGGKQMDLSPGLSPRLGLELGANIDRFLVAATFETWTLSQSDPNKDGFLQPRSTRTTFGARVGYAF